MRLQRLLLLTLLAGCIAAAADQNPKAFSGTWEGKYKDTVYCVLKVNAAEPLSGSMSVGQIDTDDAGDLKSAGPAAGDGYPLVNPRVEDGKLLFSWNDDSGDEPVKLELTIAADGHSELRFLSTPADVKIKPLKLARKD